MKAVRAGGTDGTDASGCSLIASVWFGGGSSRFYAEGMQPYEGLKAWHASHSLALAVFRATRSWPRSELYGLTAQLKRAAISAPTNLVEGRARLGSREFRRFVGISLGSLAEVGYLLRFAYELKLLSEHDWTALEKQRESASKLTWLLLKSLREAEEHRPS